ncbi:MAG: hypothetical protein ACHQ49_04875 [Elusimicrobiota bacterium]
MNNLPDVAPDDLIVLALDREEGGAAARAYFAATGAELSGGKPARRVADAGGLECAGRVLVALAPTRTYAEGMGGGTSDRAPEDRRLIRGLERRFPGRVTCALIGQAGSAAPASGGPKGFVDLHLDLLRKAPDIMRECWTVPNRQDYMYLATKTFGLNLVVRLAFTGKAVLKGDLPLIRGVMSTTWYQFQDTVFTVFGQTYMKFLGRMTGMLRVGPMYIGDFTFVYVQLCFFEFLNRLVLGPLGENPLVYTWHGMALIFVNILQGMISGGPLIPAINKMRRAGVISHPTMMHFYQLSSLTMQFGLFASFGYQRFYFLLTSATLVLSWGGYAIFSLFFADAPAEPAASGLAARLDALASIS